MSISWIVLIVLAFLFFGTIGPATARVPVVVTADEAPETAGPVPVVINGLPGANLDEEAFTSGAVKHPTAEGDA